ncbi:MAG: Tat pathway signal protein [Candidatus Latescibacteria bacterium]|jgi:hypothetical protein|nr:Tat pathway signal protein [Candidatus Latescibacterota bacterium]
MAKKKSKKKKGELIWAYLLHLGYNMWADREATDWGITHVSAEDEVRVERDVWDDVLHRLKDAGANMVVIDLGEGVRYRSHPEIAVRGSWSVKRLRRRLKAIRRLGLEPIPKLNFSTAHDAWMGPYARCVSTKPYYKACKDLIREVVDLFDKPRFFHLGMDEETAEHQRHYAYMLVRQFDLWWHDLEILLEQVDVFFKRMPASVVQSNWYYGSSFGQKVAAARTYRDIEEHGYDQIPTGSNWSCPENFQKTVTYARRHIAPERLLGFLQTVWRPTLGECRDRHIEAIDLLTKAHKSWLRRQASADRETSATN